MSENVIQFPARRRQPATNRSAASGKSRMKARLVVRILFFGVLNLIWLILGLMWPWIQWIVSLECFFRALAAIYHWHDPSSHAGLVFLLHFSGGVAMTYFFVAYRPKSLRAPVQAAKAA